MNGFINIFIYLFFIVYWEFKDFEGCWGEFYDGVFIEGCFGIIEGGCFFRFFGRYLDVCVVDR